MIELEERARKEYDRLTAEAVLESIRNPDVSMQVPVMQELVALGIEDGDGMLWWELENVATPNADGRGEFFVDGMRIFDTLKAAADQLGYLRIGRDMRHCIDAMLREKVCVIWHTHTATADPSREDIAEFPEWLADYGMVYHVPTDTTTVYNNSGTISSLGSNSLQPIATQET